MCTCLREESTDRYRDSVRYLSYSVRAVAVAFNGIQWPGISANRLIGIHSTHSVWPGNPKDKLSYRQRALSLHHQLQLLLVEMYRDADR